MINHNQPPDSRFNLYTIVKSPVARVAALALVAAGVSAGLWEFSRSRSPEAQTYTTAQLDERYSNHHITRSDFDPDNYEIFLGSNQFNVAGRDVYVTSNGRTWTQLPLHDNGDFIDAAQFADEPNDKGGVELDVSFVDPSGTHATSELFAINTQDGSIMEDGQASGAFGTANPESEVSWSSTTGNRLSFTLSNADPAGRPVSLTVVENP